MSGDMIGEAGRGSPCLGVQAVTISGERPGCVEYPSVGVELMLVGGAVADPHGPAVAIARPIVERSFVTRTFAVEREQNRKARAIEPARVQ